MFDRGLKVAGALFVATSLASCSTAGMFPKPGEAYVKDVTVTAIASARNPVPGSFAPRLTEAVRQDVRRLPQTGAAKHLSITLTDYHLKNPALSLLVGDANYVKGTLTVTDLAGGPAKTAPFMVGNQGQVNGVVGAIVAANQDPGLIEGVLVVQSSRKALENFYGSKLLKTYAENPPAATPAATAAPAPASPAKVKASKPPAAKTKPVAPAAAQPGA
ncbi:hypothetical protein [Labrys neptuniae]